MAQKLPFLKTDGTRIVDEAGHPVMLKGVALGGWLMMEGYMLYGRNIAERDFKASFEKALGTDALEDYTRSFRDTFIREDDIKLIKGWGANCIRVPFNYRIIEFEDRPFNLNEEGLGYIDRIVKWCEKYSIYCILDMHAAPGAQNPDWHADCSNGKPEFFMYELNVDRYLRLWHFIADRYKYSSAVAGYDVLNEPVVPNEQEKIVKDLYDKVTKEIRAADKKHIIFLEGNLWAQRLDFMGKPADGNTAFSIHVYPPPDYVFNWETDLKYPGRVYKLMWNKNKLEFLARQYKSLIDKVRVPLYVGEFGVNWRGGSFGEAKWAKDCLDVFKKYGFHWSYWTYKTVANSVFPDGIFRYTKNPAWVNRKGPVSGWETFSSLWPKEKGSMTLSWRTENFNRNDKLYPLLKKYF
ncbi:MAG: glycoside hydrolase family 5 protein [Candidatus Omnitrophota bacterium]|nr:glycoside hydrolase family 5 protein [Candidatus Omnitrophota bacterium]